MVLLTKQGIPEDRDRPVKESGNVEVCSFAVEHTV